MSFLARSVAATTASIVLPAVLLRGMMQRRFGETLFERCGSGAWTDHSWDEGETIWFHGASVGEVGGVAPLVRAVSERYPDSEIVMTTTSLTGREEVLRKRLADRALLFPLDHPVYVRRVLDLARPRLVVLAETELWPNFLFELAARRVPVVLVNARISSYTYPRYRRFRWLFRSLLGSFAHIAAQTETDAERFVSLGAKPDSVSVVGSTKYAVPLHVVSPDERLAFARELGIDLSRPCFVAGSVRSGEDEQVIEAFDAARDVVPGLQMIIAPRHPERFLRVGDILYRYGINFRRRSSGENFSGGDSENGSSDVVLLDTLGELAKAYAIGTYAFVGGSLVDIGGHNPFEPCLARAPVIMGRYVSNVQDAVEELRSAGALLSVENKKELREAIIRLARNTDESLLRGARGFEIWQRHSLAVDRVLPFLLPYLPPRKDVERASFAA